MAKEVVPEDVPLSPRCGLPECIRHINQGSTYGKIKMDQLSVTIMNKMNTSVEVNAGLTKANRAYYGLQNHMKSRLLSRNTKGR